MKIDNHQQTELTFQEWQPTILDQLQYHGNNDFPDSETNKRRLINFRYDQKRIEQDNYRPPLKRQNNGL